VAVFPLGDTALVTFLSLERNNLVMRASFSVYKLILAELGKNVNYLNLSEMSEFVGAPLSLLLRTNQLHHQMKTE
jgi:hypothetical protein